MARRGFGGISGATNPTSKTSAGGIWTLDQHLDAVRREEWTNMLPTWDVSPIGSFTTSTASGSIVQSGGSIYLSGAGYNGGMMGWALATSHGNKLFQNNWHLDFIHNRNGVNSSPYPNYHIGFSRASSVSDFRAYQPGYTLVKSEVGNAYGFDFLLYQLQLSLVHWAKNPKICPCFVSLLSCSSTDGRLDPEI